MKNQYFGDINDYRKYGVLRILATHARVSVGICWLLTEDDRRGSGELRTYLSKPARWRSFEAQLYDRLQDLLKPDVPRQVTLAKDWGLIPNAVYFEEVLGGGEGQRTAYFARAHTVLAGCDLWFFDPDNGIEVDSVPRGRAGSSQYVYWMELQDAFRRGHSLLIYQHFPHVNRDRFVPFLATRLAEELGSPHVIAFRTAHVAFFLVSQEQHAANLDAAAMEVGALWRGQIEVWRPPDRPADGQRDSMPSVESRRGAVGSTRPKLRGRPPLAGCQENRVASGQTAVGESAMPMVSVNGVTLYWEETGHGAPLVWVHEYGGDLRSWESQVRYFSRRHRVITYNQRGYPPSTVPKAARD